MLKREVSDLNLQVQQRDATIRQLEMDHSQISPAVYQHQPTVPDSPATSTSSDAPKSAKFSQTRSACPAVSILVKRTMSDSCDRPACRVSKRRYSLLVPSSNLPVVLGNSEESEGLLSWSKTHLSKISKKNQYLYKKKTNKKKTLQQLISRFWYLNHKKS